MLALLVALSPFGIAEGVSAAPRRLAERNVRYDIRHKLGLSTTREPDDQRFLTRLCPLSHPPSFRGESHLWCRDHRGAGSDIASLGKAGIPDVGAASRQWALPHALCDRRHRASGSRRGPRPVSGPVQRGAARAFLTTLEEEPVGERARSESDRPAPQHVGGEPDQFLCGHQQRDGPQHLATLPI